MLCTNFRCISNKSFHHLFGKVSKWSLFKCTFGSRFNNFCIELFHQKIWFNTRIIAEVSWAIRPHDMHGSGSSSSKQLQTWLHGIQTKNQFTVLCFDFHTFTFVTSLNSISFSRITSNSIVLTNYIYISLSNPHLKLPLTNLSRHWHRCHFLVRLFIIVRKKILHLFILFMLFMSFITTT